MAAMDDRRGQGGHGDGEPTPAEVAELLDVAYEGRQAWIGMALAPTLTEDACAAKAGTTLTYGELHQDGLTKLLGPQGLDVDSRGARCLLELGSGRGRQALQASLQWPGLQRVLGLELVVARHRAAVIATRRLYETYAGRFAIKEVPLEDAVSASAGEKRGCCEAHVAITLSEGSGAEARTCELRLGNLLDLPAEELSVADTILLEVGMPPGPGRTAAHLQFCRLLASHCRHGCVMAAYEDLHSIWRALGPEAPPCPFHKLPLCEGGYATSWSTSGHHYHGFRCDRELPASVEPGAWL